MLQLLIYDKKNHWQNMWMPPNLAHDIDDENSKLITIFDLISALGIQQIGERL